MRGCSPCCLRISEHTSGSGMPLHHLCLVCPDLTNIPSMGRVPAVCAHHSHACMQPYGIPLIWCKKVLRVSDSFVCDTHRQFVLSACHISIRAV